MTVPVPAVLVLVGDGVGEADPELEVDDEVPPDEQAASAAMQAKDTAATAVGRVIVRKRMERR